MIKEGAKNLIQFISKNFRGIAGKELLHIERKIKDRIGFIVIGALSMMSLCMLFIPGLIVQPEPEHHYMIGIGGESYGEDFQEITFSQEFVPRYGEIKNIQLDIDKNGIEEGGFLRWNITDRKGNIISGGNIPYEEVADNIYTEIELNIHVKSWHRYYMNVSFDKVNSSYPKMILNHGEEKIKEGKRLFCNGECLEGMNFVWGILYGDVVPLKHKIPSLTFSIIAVIVFLIKDKWKAWMKLVITSVAFLVIPKYIIYYGECIIDGPVNWFSEATLSSNCAILYLIIAGMILLNQSPKWTLRLGSILVGILYIADFFVLRFRGSTMKIWDILSVRTAGEVAGNYSYKISGDILVLIVFLIFIWSISYSFSEIKCKLKYRIFMSIIGIIYFIGMYYTIRQDSFWNKLEGVYCSAAFDAEQCYRKSGYLASFLFQIKEDRVKKPENYEREKVESLLAESRKIQKSEQKKPHIIVIVNESLADLEVFGEILPEEPMSFMKALEKDVIKGYVDVSVLGGGTSDSEYEFLTGNSMVYFPQGMYPFNKINEQQGSLVWDLREMGYETYAMHPAAASNWNRKTVYPLLGFENYYWIEDFKEAEKVHFGVSDKETYQKIIDIYESRAPEEVQFIYDMTIQNHGGYEEIDVDEALESNYTTVSEYLSLVRSSDRDLEELIEYFKCQSEDVLLCIFGDHQPVLESKFYEDIFAQNGKSEQENFLSQYKTPFWIWANYDIEEREDIEISLNYLGGLLFETAGLSKTPYMQYVSEVRNEYPVLTINGYRDKEGTFYTLEKLPDKLKEYEKVQYYYLYDKDNDH